jgi:hypothetical protein
MGIFRDIDLASNLLALEGDTTCVAVKEMMLNEAVSGEDAFEERTTRTNLETLLALCVDEAEDAKLIHPKLVSIQNVSEEFDTAPVMKWLKSCQIGHSSSCISTTPPLSETLTLVDCVETMICRHNHIDHTCGLRCSGKKICTVQVEPAHLDKPGYEYLALSYVWGETRPAKWDPTENEDANPKPPSSIVLGPRLVKVAATISDAVQVTMALGRRYLWVDQYCIDQENPVNKGKQIRQMRRIYEKADIALVAAAGEDANYGLPGVHDRKRTVPLTLNVAGVTVRSIPRLPQKVILSSAWATRGWTYEEAFLSRRRLVFLDDQVYYECNVSHACERIAVSEEKGPAGEPLVPLLTLFGANVASQLRELVQASDRYREVQKTDQNDAPQPVPQMEHFSSYLSAVTGFTQRTLTRPVDSLHAFIGMMEKFQDHQTVPIYHVWGVPFPAGSEVSSTDCTRFFATGLCWSHHAPFQEDDEGGNWDSEGRIYYIWIHETRASRRPKFPSWAWAGWEGKVDFPMSMRSGGHGLLENVMCHVCFRNGDGDASSLTLESLAQLNRSNGPGASHPRTLVLIAPVIPPFLLDDSNFTGVHVRLDAENADSLDSLSRFVRVKGWKKKLGQGKDIHCVWMGQLGPEGWGLVLARDRNRKRKDGDTYHRLGIIEITIDKAMVGNTDIRKWDVRTFEIA